MRKLVITLVLLFAVFTVIRAIDSSKNESIPKTASIHAERPSAATE
jgi:hypothetical protein